MRKSDARLCGQLSEKEANRVVVLLSSMGIEPGVEQEQDGRLAVYVAPEDYEAAARLLAEELPVEPFQEHEEREASTEPPPDPFGDPEVLAPETWFGRGTPAVLLIIALCVGMFVVAQTGTDGGSRSRMLELGAIAYSRVEAGEHWRFLSAIFLHFDALHLLANMGAMIVLAPPLAHQIGTFRFLALFVCTGFAGNVVSHLFAPAVGMKAGASGAIAGVLGGLGGQALRPGRRTRYRSWQILGALAAFYGLLIGFGPGRDNFAHVGGLLAGLLLGRLIRPQPEARSAGAFRVPPSPTRSS